MDGYRTEEDQIKALKDWWEQNGSSLLIGIGLAMVIVFGWQWWKQRHTQQVETAAAQYQQLVEASQLSASDEIQRTTAETLAKELQQKQSGSRYGDYGTLILARIYVEKNDLAAAASELRKLLDNGDDAHIRAMARIRLARVLLAMDKVDEARALVEPVTGTEFKAELAELRGDILAARADTTAALAAYRSAKEIAGSDKGERPNPILALKLQELELRTGKPAAPNAGAAEASKPIQAVESAAEEK